MKTILKHADASIDEDKWLKRLDKNIQKTAVQSRVVDDHLFNQMISIMNKSKSKYSSVDAVVKDMQERSGLTAYLENNINKLSSNKKSKYYTLGFEHGKTNKDKKDIVSIIASINPPIPIKKYSEYAEGFTIAMKLEYKEQIKQLNRVAQYTERKIKNIIGQINNTTSVLPKAIQSYPNVKSTIENYIKDSKGNLSIPAILAKVRSIHQNDVPSEDWEDEGLVRYINQLNINEKKNNPTNFNNDNNLGYADVGNNAEIDPSNMDAFNILTPAK